jgi:3-oxoadipate enol-lactonase
MTLAHDVAGDGPAVVLLHSTVVDRRMWDAQVSALTAAGRRAIRCDFRGFGETPLPDLPFNDADDVFDILDGLEVDEFALVGASGGGQVAQEMAARQPGRVTALMLLCTAMAGHERGPALRAFGEREDALLTAGDVDGAVELNVETWLGPETNDQTRAAVRVMQRRVFDIQLAVAEEPEPIEYEFDLSAITARTLLVTGAHDFPDFRQIADTLAATVPDAARLDLDWAGHLPSLERPDLINPIILDFLGSPQK